MIKRLIAHLPKETQEGLKQRRFRKQIRKGTFIPDEPEIHDITRLVRPGDTVIDVGANAGHYTLHMSQCVGPTGRVIALEPVPDTFAILSANVQATWARNVTLMNVAASDGYGFVSIDLPKFPSGLDNYYRASISDSGEFICMRIPLDALALALPHVNLIKIDAEGHDMQVLIGALRLIERDHPALIVECGLNGEIADWLRARGYTLRHTPGSPNIVAQA